MYRTRVNVSCAYFCLESFAFQKHCIYLTERQITYSGTLKSDDWSIRHPTISIKRYISICFLHNFPTSEASFALNRLCLAIRWRRVSFWKKMHWLRTSYFMKCPCTPDHKHVAKEDELTRSRNQIEPKTFLSRDSSEGEIWKLEKLLPIFLCLMT